MSQLLSSLPPLGQFFPPTPAAFSLIQSVFRTFPLLTLIMWFVPSPMGKTSSNSKLLNLPGRYAWSVAELVGPVNLLYILYSLPQRLVPLSSTTTTTSISPRTGLFGTGLPITHEIMGLLYVLHYVNRAVVTPLYAAPSMSPIHVVVFVAMAGFQFLNSSSLAGWICYDAQRQVVTLSSAEVDARLISPLSMVGVVLFIAGLAGNIASEWHLFELRRGAAKRKAKSEGKAVVTYEKVYVIPEPRALFKYILFPHYSLEWLEWTGYWVLGIAWGLGWSWRVSAALMFLVNESASMTPRAYDGVAWYERRFGKRAVAGRKAVIPGVL